MSIRIDSIEYFLPERIVTNEDLRREHPAWEMEKVELKSGVASRHIAGDDETALDLAINACEKLFASGACGRNGFDGIIFCTQTPDYIMPSNAFLLHKHLDLPDGILAFDFNLACSGFIYGLAIAQGFILSNIARRILLVTADTYSKIINRGDRSARVLFGDAAAASLISGAGSGKGIIDVSLATSGKSFDTFYVPAGGFRIPKSGKTSVEKEDSSGNIRTLNDIYMNGFSVWKFIQSTVPRQIRDLLARNGRAVDDVDLFVFHQASRMTLDSLVKALKIDPKKAFSNLGRIGNTVSASIPIAMKDAANQGILSRGQTILLSGFGVGLSWGSILMEY